MLFELFCFLLVGFELVLAKNSACPELQRDLQEHQDFSTCFPESDKWVLMYRNYYSDPDFGGAAKCVTYKSFGSYQNFSTPGVFSFEDGSISGLVTFDYASPFRSRNKATFAPYNDSAPKEMFHAIYVDCPMCAISQHYHADKGHGCTYWRRPETLHEPADCCDRIFDKHCGKTPKYQIYDGSCESKA